ncbi:MAG: hypothetical protein H6502_02420 [Candidatus Woesearchaeota archaeon]|nr:MAG: hypothetical protein H6502_02420 [Candidatus Woesearchaeota archaeon]
MERLIALKKLLKRRKPKFIRQDAHKKPRLASRWIRPRGIDSKIRLKLRGYRKQPEIGYKMPVAVRGLSMDGLVLVHVHSEKELLALNKKTEAAVLAKMSRMKKAALIAVAQKNNITIKNLSVKAYLAKITEVQEAKKKVHEKKQAKTLQQKVAAAAKEKEAKASAEAESTVTEEKKKEAPKKSTATPDQTKKAGVETPAAKDSTQQTTKK